MNYYTIGNDGIEWVTGGPFQSIELAKRYAMNHTIDRPGRWDRVPEIWAEKDTFACMPTMNNPKGIAPHYGKGRGPLLRFDSFTDRWMH